MCGFVGALSHTGQLPSPDRLAVASDALRQRGPDDSGTWSDPQVLFGHRRLAVLDLSPAGHQPMQTADGRFVIVYNGEIYNHLELRDRLPTPPGGWRSTSDTETILEAYRAWGPESLSQLNGMFAFAIWDRSERRMFLARDRMGVKPLYYASRAQCLAFASRPRSLLALDPELGARTDPEALKIYLELGYMPAPLTFYAAVRKLPPAHFIICDARGLSIQRYWDFRPVQPDASALLRPQGELLEELGALLREAVRARLLADVPLGAFLSGGIDSALVVAAMMHAGVAAPKTFTIGFREKSFDESHDAARTAAHFGVDHTTETLDVDSLLNLLPTYVEEFDEPFADSSAFPTMAVSRLARRTVTVALTGDGGDELFGGYHYYRIAQHLRDFQGLPAALRRAARRVLGVMPAHRAKLLSEVIASDDVAATHAFMRGIGKDFGLLLREDALIGTTDAASWFAGSAASFAGELSPADVGMRLDAMYVLPDLYLQKVDVASMAFSLEAREPLLDYRLVEWAMRLPVELKIRGSTTKYLLKQLLCRNLPDEFVHRPKRGFSVPVATWLRGPLREWATQLLHDRELVERASLEPVRVQSLLNLHLDGSRDAHPLLWGILMLLCFIAHHDRGHTLPSVTAPRAPITGARYSRPPLRPTGT
jgi:asparagine synthase (glutamine-hydrolysing)